MPLTASTQKDLFAARGVSLPTTGGLMRRFRAFNSWYWSDFLPPAQVCWSTRMRIAGSCDYGRCIITLSRSYHEQFPDDLSDTLKHEMIHLVHHNHGAAFRREAIRVGATVHCREYPGLHPRARHIYVCPTCGTEFHRVRRERLFCGRCSGHRADERFELVLRPSPGERRRPNRLAARGGRRRMRSGFRAVWAAADLFR